ncbi:MAG: fluoride efflux transporter CrcB [Myxococcota bacterium]|nr:fluoride efflux transporter CrcB [Myxococcota bacterium]
MTQLWTLGWIGLGGAMGACGRYLLSNLMANWLGRDFPYGTLVANVLGSAILGALSAALQQGLLADTPWRPMLTIGLLGALTTFSTFSMDNILLLQDGALGKLLANIILNVGLSFVAAYLAFHFFPQT